MISHVYKMVVNASAPQTDSHIEVSSTLNRDTKQFGKKFLFDGREETCWNSDQVAIEFVFSIVNCDLQGSPQWVSLEFEHINFALFLAISADIFPHVTKGLLF